MSKILLSATVLACSLFSLGAFAHGTPASQAAAAITVATNMFNASAARDVQRQFLGVSATLAGHERFTVTIALKNKTTISYDCIENEDVDPVVWECKAI